MMKRFWTFPLLALAVLLSACASGQASRPILPQPAITSVEKVVTLAPQGDQTTPAQPATPPPSRVIDEQARVTAIAKLRVLLGDQQLELAYKGMDRSPNATNHPAVLFVDPQGNSYYVNPDTLLPIEFTLAQPIRETQGSPKTPDELRAIAEQIAKAQSVRFEALRDRLTYSEGIKGENNFFRWEMAGTDVGGMPAILQIGLKQDGSLFGYLNSLDFLP